MRFNVEDRRGRSFATRLQDGACSNPSLTPNHIKTSMLVITSSLELLNPFLYCGGALVVRKHSQRMASPPKSNDCTVPPGNAVQTVQSVPAGGLITSGSRALACKHAIDSFE